MVGRSTVLSWKTLRNLYCLSARSDHLSCYPSQYGAEYSSFYVRQRGQRLQLFHVHEYTRAVYGARRARAEGAPCGVGGGGDSRRARALIARRRGRGARRRVHRADGRHPGGWVATVRHARPRVGGGGAPCAAAGGSGEARASCETASSTKSKRNGCAAPASSTGRGQGILQRHGDLRIEAMYRLYHFCNV